MLSVPHPPQRGRPHHARVAWRLGWWALWLLLASAAHGRGVAVPDFAVRAPLAIEVGESFMLDLRTALRAGGIDVSDAPLITPGIAGSLDPDFAQLVARLEGTRYAILGELHDRAGAQAVDLLIVDAESGRVGDLLSRTFAPADRPDVIADLAFALLDFMTVAPPLPPGNAGLFISSVPPGAQVWVEGVDVGRTGALDLLTLAPGRYEVEVRSVGYLADVRTVDLRADDTRFLHVVLTELVGGSLQIVARPLPARVLLDDQDAGVTPTTVTAAAGERSIVLTRPGFAPRNLRVPVRQFRVTRVEADLEPLAEPLLVWPTGAFVRVIIDGVLQEDGFALPTPGLRTVEILQGGEVRRFTVAIPASGVYELLPDTGELRPLNR